MKRHVITASARTHSQWRPALAGSCLALGLALSLLPAAAQSEDADLRALLERAARSYEREDYKGARRAYEEATRLDPGSISAWRGLGSTLWQLGDHERAFRVWLDVAQVRPDDLEIQLSLAQAYEYRSEWQQAHAFYSKVLDVQPQRLPARMGRARTGRQLGQEERAEQDLQVVLERSPELFDAQFMLAEIYRSSGRADEAVVIFERLAQQGPAPDRLRPLADVLLQSGRPEPAARFYEQHLERNPDDSGAVNGLVRAYAELQRYEDAIPVLERRLARNADDSAAVRSLVRAYAVLQQYADAIPALERYLARKPDDASIREHLVQFADQIGDYERVQAQLRILARQHPEDPRWRMRLARALQMAGDVDGSVAIARKLLEEDAGNLDALGLMFDIAVHQERLEDSIAWLERIASAAPDAARLSRLGELNIALGDRHAASGDTEAARAAYRRAAAAFHRGAQVDPLSADARIGQSTALRLAGDHERAIELAMQILAGHPRVERARREIYEAQSMLGEHAQAEALAREMLEFNPGSIRLRHERARARFRAGESDAAIADVEDLLAQPIDRSVPVLLYHGISAAEIRADAMPLRNFRDQMHALRREGYQPIDIHQLIAFHEKGAALPPKPVMITFDDARADSFRYADPVLEETGLRATMFVPVAEVGKRGPYSAVWSTVHSMWKSGRWDIQCHGNEAHDPIPVDGQGRRGAYLANRMWLAGSERLETREEFVARVEGDYRACGETLLAQLPGLDLAGYAYPFGELGQKALSNEPDAVAINKSLVEKYYRVGFVQDQAAEVTRLSARTVMPRFEVPAHFTGVDLIGHLRGVDAYRTTQLLLADLYAWDGRYAHAESVLDEVAHSEDVDPAELLVRQGRIRLWQGDLGEARRSFETATQLQASSRVAHENIEQIDRRRRPTTTMDSAFYSDNRDRANFSVGPAAKLHLTDRLTLTTTYRYRQLVDDGVESAQVQGRVAIAEDEPGFGGPVDLRVIGNEMEARLGYRWSARSELSLSGGAARFENRSSQRALDGADTFPLVSAVLRLPIGPIVDASLRASQGYVAAAGPILEGLASTGGEGRLQLRPLTNTTLDGRYAYARYDDGNHRTTGVLSLMQRIVQSPDIRIGYRYSFDHAQMQHPLFYTPDRYVGNDGVIRLIARPLPRLSLEAEATVGAGQERGSDRKLQVSVSGTGRVQVAESLSLFASGARSQAAEFESFQITGGLSLTY